MLDAFRSLLNDFNCCIFTALCLFLYVRVWLCVNGLLSSLLSKKIYITLVLGKLESPCYKRICAHQWTQGGPHCCYISPCSNNHWLVLPLSLILSSKIVDFSLNWGSFLIERVKYNNWNELQRCIQSSMLKRVAYLRGQLFPERETI